MRVLLCHNYYQQRGGEDQSFELERDLLQNQGHEVRLFTVHNDAISQMKSWQVAWKTFWNRDAYRKLKETIRQHQPDVVHCTNGFPLLSSAVWTAAREAQVPMVQSLRNYRFLCPGALFLRDGRICEDCLGRSVPWPAVVHGCYRQSRAGSAVVAGMIAGQRLLRTWQKKIDLFFTPTRFARGKLIEGGLPAERILVKPNFIDPDPGPGNGSSRDAIFVGRLSPEKGIDTLLSAWRANPRLPTLRIVGDGPLQDSVQQAARRDARIKPLGRCPLDRVLSFIGEAACLLMPSIWYETFGRTIIEAYAKGTPVIASNLGAMAELVRNGKTGYLVEPGDAEDLAGAVTRLMKGDQQIPMRQEARLEYEKKYTAKQNYHLLMDIYHHAIELRQSVRSSSFGTCH